jgi:hypothetical protein
MLHKLLISYDFSPMDVSSANNLHKPIVSSAKFLAGHSTTHQLIEFINDIFMALDNRELICLILCDVSKDFDRVWLRGLLLKLERYGIKGNLLQGLGSCMSVRAPL